MVTTFEQMAHEHKYKLLSKTVSELRYVLYNKYYIFFSCLQQPVNRYQINGITHIEYDEINKLIDEFIRLQLIEMVELNSNKYMLTTKGRYALYQIVELNKLMGNELTKHEFISNTS